jgi:alkylation response protein AidB-like acyl-CoA dehydrogenase
VQTQIPSRSEVAERRDTLRAWLQAERGRLPGSRAGEPVDLEGAMEQELSLQRALWDAGFTRSGWPTPCGGSGDSALLRAAAYEELTLACRQRVNTDPVAAAEL